MIQYKGYSFVGALFAITMNLATALSYVVTIITFGWVGRRWPLRLALFSLDHPYNVVYKDGVDAENDDDEHTNEEQEPNEEQDSSGSYAGSMCELDSSVIIPTHVQMLADAFKQAGMLVDIGEAHWANGEDGITCNVGEFVDTLHSLDGDREKVQGITTTPTMTFFFNSDGKITELDLPRCHLKVSKLIERNKNIREKYGHLNKEGVQ